jgi:dihydroorotate dehydrogenase (NAD+) catalytic subunit
MLNAIGLDNIGIEAFAREVWPSLRRFDVPIIANFFGDDEAEFLKAAQMLSEIDGLFALELNLSCPNKPQWGSILASDPITASRLVALIKPYCRYPLIVKLSPNVTDITKVAKACEDSGADALSLINTLLGMAIDLKSRQYTLGSRFGGLSGPAIFPVALRMVYQVSGCVKIPLIGMGGVFSSTDAIAMMMAGASLIGLGTLLLVDPSRIAEIKDGIMGYLKESGLNGLEELRGLLGRSLPV